MYSLESSSTADPFAQFGGVGFTASPTYNKPGLDLGNPLHLAIIAGAVVLFLYLRKR